jgi:hypothetical protein
MIFKITSVICLSFLLLLSASALDEGKDEYLPLTGIIFVLVVFIPLLYIVLN